jgi:hypothetical protein
MFCPECKSEYRTGFTRCADCGVDLVEHLSQELSQGDGDIPTDSEGRRLLWSGLSSEFLAGICKALDGAKIEHVETAKAFGLLPNYQQSASFIWVAVRDYDAARSVIDGFYANPDTKDLVADEERAQGRQRIPVRPGAIADSTRPLRDSVFGRLFGLSSGVSGIENDSQDRPDDPEGEFSLPISDSDEQGDNEPAPDDLLEDFHPDDATAEVWAGEDSVMAENLSICLRNVGVGCVLHEDGAKSRLLVLPEQEKRAREVVQQILDAT